MITSRRSLFGFGAALIAAPAIVRVASIMPVSVPRVDFREHCEQMSLIVSETWWRIVMADQQVSGHFLVVPNRLAIAT